MPKELLETQTPLDPERQAQRDAVTDKTQVEHNSLLQAIHRLESKLAAAASGRERDWTDKVLVDLRCLRDIFRQHVESSGKSEGLFDELAIACPHWTPRMDRLQERQDALLLQLNSLISQVENHDRLDIPDFGDLRRRIGGVIGEVRTVQALENDLLFECFLRDLGVGD
jgi:hypothetical protein